MEITELGCTGPITVLPQPTGVYHENIEIPEKDHQWIYHFITRQDDKLYQIRIFLSGKNGIYYLTDEHELLHYIQRLYEKNEITLWIFFHTKNKVKYPNDYTGFCIDPASKNTKITEDPDVSIKSDSVNIKYQGQGTPPNYVNILPMGDPKHLIEEGPYMFGHNDQPPVSAGVKTSPSTNTSLYTDSSLYNSTPGNSSQSDNSSESNKHNKKPAAKKTKTL